MGRLVKAIPNRRPPTVDRRFARLQINIHLIERRFIPSRIGSDKNQRRFYNPNLAVAFWTGVVLIEY